MSTAPANQYEVIVPELDDRGRYHASKILMEWLDMSWPEARDLVSRPPTILACGPDPDKAEAIRAALAEVGITATVQGVDAATLRQHLFLAAGMSTATPPFSPFTVRRPFWWALALFALPFLLYQALNRLQLYSAYAPPPAQLLVEIEQEATAVTVRNLTRAGWQGCTAAINDIFAQQFAELPASGSVRLSLGEFIGRGPERGGQRYLAGTGEPGGPILSFTVSCSEPPGWWRRTF
ncbi:MAG: hypothetical protein HY660_09245 [Armatimonadetes bacterium]|nr:hypothetical protein [Armatimonadota bacterium]